MCALWEISFCAISLLLLLHSVSAGPKEGDEPEPFIFENADGDNITLFEPFIGLELELFNGGPNGGAIGLEAALA